MALTAVSSLSSNSCLEQDLFSQGLGDSGKPAVPAKLIQDFLTQLNRKVKIANEVLAPTRRVTAFVRVFVNIPKNIHTAIRGTKLMAGVSGLCCLPQLASDAGQVVSQEGLANKVKAVGWALLNTAEVISHAAEFTDGLEHIGMLSEEQAAWTSKVQIAFWPLQIISLGMGAYKVYKINEFRRDYQKFIKANTTPETKPQEVVQEVAQKESLTRVEPVERVEVIASLLFVTEFSEKTLRSCLDLGKNYQLKELAMNLANIILTSCKEQKTKALEQGEKFMENLKSRIKKKLAYEIVSIVVEIATLACAIICFVTASTGALALGVMAFLSVSSLALFAYKKTELARYPSFVS